MIRYQSEIPCPSCGSCFVAAQILGPQVSVACDVCSGRRPLAREDVSLIREECWRLAGFFLDRPSEEEAGGGAAK